MASWCRVPSTTCRRCSESLVDVWHRGKFKSSTFGCAVIFERQQFRRQTTLATARGSSAPIPMSMPGQVTLQSLPLKELTDLVDRIRAQGEAPKEVVEWMSATVGSLATEQRERAALMKRSWSDTAFEDGEEGNEKTIEGFELDLVSMLQSSPQGLDDADILGNAIDLAGAYKKNYKLDNSEAVLLRCTRHAERRSGAWMVKYLNHLSQVRMKQARNMEALEMMYEMESLATFTQDVPGGSSFYETLYRNMSSALRSLHREEEAALYFMKMVQASRHHKPSMDWMDLWELAVLIANRAYQTERWTEFYRARDMLKEALRMQKCAEPDDHIMRAKVLSNLGQCYLATQEHSEADIYYSEAYDLFNRTVGKRSPLFGMQAWACANLRCAERRYAEALPLLGESLYVEVVKDGLSVPEMTKLLDQILMSLHESNATFDESATEPIERSLSTLIVDPRWEDLEDSVDLALLSHKMSLVYVAARWRRSSSWHVAARYSKRAVGVLRSSGSSQEMSQWREQVDMVHKAMFERPPRT